MARKIIRIVYDPYGNHIRFNISLDTGDTWQELPEISELLKYQNQECVFSNCVEDIVGYINQYQNSSPDGLCIQFIGPDEDFAILDDVVKKENKHFSKKGKIQPARSGVYKSADEAIEIIRSAYNRISSEYDPEYITRKSDLDFIECLDRINCDGAVKALLIDFCRTPFENAQMIWQKLAFKYFNIRECVKGLTTMVPFEEWNNIIVTQLEKYEFDESISLSKDSEQFYRFTQLMTLESLLWLQASQIDQPEKGLQLKNYMSEFRDSFLKSN